jgi:putative transposase
VVYGEYGISEQTYYRWRQLYGMLDVPHLRRLKQLEAENARLKRLVAEQMLATEAFKEVQKRRR